MKDLHKAAESLAVGMSRVLQEWVSSCLFGCLFIAVLMGGTAIYVVLNEWTHLLPLTIEAFQ